MAPAAQVATAELVALEELVELAVSAALVEQAALAVAAARESSQRDVKNTTFELSATRRNLDQASSRTTHLRHIGALRRA